MTRLERRWFMVGTLSLLAAPLAAEAQEAGHSLVTSNRCEMTRR
jgi:hypothetical protein